MSVSRHASRRPQLRSFPVNAFEAESRRLARFFRMGHTPGAVDAPPRGDEPEIPVYARSAQRVTVGLLMSDEADGASAAIAYDLARGIRGLTPDATMSCSTQAARCARIGVRSSIAWPRTARPDAARRRRRAGAPPDRRERRHLQRLCRSAGRRSSLGARSVAVRSDGRRMARDRSGRRCSARGRPRCAARRSVRTAATAAEGLAPAALPFGHPNFLWPCHGLTPRGDRWLHVYAADLARAPDGRWWVLADRTQTPSGAGYALENREIVARVLPEGVARPARAPGARRSSEAFASSC